MKQDIYLNCLAYQLSQARKLAISWYEDVLMPLNLSPNLVYVLGVIDDKKKVSPTDISILLNLSKTTITPLLDRLEQKGFINRIAHETKRTSYYVSLTTDGKAICQKAYKTLQEADKKLDGRLSHSLPQIKKHLLTLNDVLKEEHIS